jgi:hypothetical protein
MPSSHQFSLSEYSVMEEAKVPSLRPSALGSRIHLEGVRIQR